MPYSKMLVTEQAILKVPMVNDLIIPEKTLAARMKPLSRVGKETGLKVAQNLFVSDGCILTQTERKIQLLDPFFCGY
jgi:hypothetical protein